MPSLEYFLVCESMSTDQTTNRVSLFNVLEDLQLPGSQEDPAHQFVISNIVAVACWNQEAGDEGRDFQAIVKIHLPNQEATDYPVNFLMERPRQRVSLRFQGMPKLEPGKLKFELLLNGKHIAWHTVNIFPPVDGLSASDEESH